MSAFPGVSSYQSSSLGSKFVVIGVVCCQEMRRNALFHKVLPVLTKYFYIRIDQFNQQEDIDFQTFEIEGDSVIEYSSHGKEFFIFSNYDTTTATWNDGSSTLQRIWGELTKEELKTIIDVMEEFK